MSLWKNTKFSWDKWNCREVWFYRILFLISQNLPFDCHFTYRKTFQLIACCPILFKRKAKPIILNVSTSKKLKNQKLGYVTVGIAVEMDSRIYTITNQSVSLLGDPFSSSSVNKELWSVQIWVLIKLRYHRISASIVLIISWTVFLRARAHAEL